MSTDWRVLRTLRSRLYELHQEQEEIERAIEETVKQIVEVQDSMKRRAAA